MTDKLKEILDEEGDKIKRLESFVRAIYKQKIKTNSDGTQSVEMTPAELRELVEVEDKIIQMKRRRNGIPDKFK